MHKKPLNLHYSNTENQMEYKNSPKHWLRAVCCGYYDRWSLSLQAFLIRKLAYPKRISPPTSAW